MPLVLAGVSVEDDHPLVVVPVGDEQFICWGVHPDGRRPGEIPGAVVVAGLAAVAYLHDELPGRRELEHHVIQADDPDVALVIDVDPMLRCGPFVARAVLAAPGLDESARIVELQHRGRGPRALALWQRPRTMDDPDVVVLVGRRIGHGAELPFLWKFGPRGV